MQGRGWEIMGSSADRTPLKRSKIGRYERQERDL
jgi:hypothetical protein